MIRRPIWLGTGVVIGVGGTLWAQQRLRRAVENAKANLSPDHVARSAARSAQRLPGRLRAANAAAASERRRSEWELRQRFASGGEPVRAGQGVRSAVGR